MSHPERVGLVIASVVALLIGGCTDSEQFQIANQSEEAPVKLYEEVKRLNTACVGAGGGVSGSPDCDAATVKEEQLEKLGYCIDYPNNEMLARCGDLTWRP